MPVNNNRRKWAVSGPVAPEAVARGRKYADPQLQRISDKWRNGDPRTNDRIIQPHGITMETKNPQVRKIIIVSAPRHHHDWGIYDI